MDVVNRVTKLLLDRLVRVVGPELVIFIDGAGDDPEVQVLGILPTKFDSRRNHDNEQLALIREFGASQRVRVLEPVRYTTAFDKASDEGLPVSEMRTGPSAIENYQQLADELLNRGTNPHPSV